jgi:hypothetical protein
VDWKSLLWPWGRIRELAEVAEILHRRNLDEQETNRNLLKSVGTLADSYEKLTSDIHQGKLKAHTENRCLYEKVEETEKAVQFIAEGVQQWLEARNAEVAARVEAMQAPKPKKRRKRT